jgi:hypothetical protein
VPADAGTRIVADAKHLNEFAFRQAGKSLSPQFLGMKPLGYRLGRREGSSLEIVAPSEGSRQAFAGPLMKRNGLNAVHPFA